MKKLKKMNILVSLFAMFSLFSLSSVSAMESRNKNYKIENYNNFYTYESEKEFFINLNNIDIENKIKENTDLFSKKLVKLENKFNEAFEDIKLKGALQFIKFDGTSKDLSDFYKKIILTFEKDDGTSSLDHLLQNITRLELREECSKLFFGVRINNAHSYLNGFPNNFCLDKLLSFDCADYENGLAFLKFIVEKYIEKVKEKKKYIEKENIFRKQDNLKLIEYVNKKYNNEQKHKERNFNEEKPNENVNNNFNPYNYDYGSGIFYDDEAYKNSYDESCENSDKNFNPFDINYDEIFNLQLYDLGEKNLPIDSFTFDIGYNAKQSEEDLELMERIEEEINGMDFSSEGVKLYEKDKEYSDLPIFYEIVYKKCMKILKELLSKKNLKQDELFYPENIRKIEILDNFKVKLSFRYIIPENNIEKKDKKVNELLNDNNPAFSFLKAIIKKYLNLKSGCSLRKGEEINNFQKIFELKQNNKSIPEKHENNNNILEEEKIIDRKKLKQEREERIIDRKKLKQEREESNSDDYKPIKRKQVYNTPQGK